MEERISILIWYNFGYSSLNSSYEKNNSIHFCNEYWPI
jgi:hypothetical protein